MRTALQQIEAVLEQEVADGSTQISIDKMIKIVRDYQRDERQQIIQARNSGLVGYLRVHPIDSEKYYEDLYGK